MSNATRCPVCGYVYWSYSNENWGTCTDCGKNNDGWYQSEEFKDVPILVDSKYIFKKIPSDRQVLESTEDKDLPLLINQDWLGKEGKKAYKERVKNVDIPSNMEGFEA